MARTITDEDIKLNIIINGNPAQKQLLDLEKETRKYTEENKTLQLELKRVERSLGKNSKEYIELNAIIKQNTTVIDNNKATMRQLQNQIGITGLTMKQLGQQASVLKLQLANAIPGSESYKNYNTQLSAVNSRLDELRGKGTLASNSISSIADKFNRYQALGFSVIATLTGVVLSVQKIIDFNSKLSESYADVMKTTGMNKREVDELTKSFGLFETRTSKIDLLKIAEQGGRIGIAKAEIGSFVEEMNKANVALGDSFTGGVEEVANKLGKLKFLFEETKDADITTAYNSIGSAINELGANGVASEANITEFTTRLGSLPAALKPSIKEALALGAAFEESGIEAEVSARAYNIFMKQASTESGKFAQVMGVSKKAVEEMINTNPLDFMMKFAEGMKDMNATDTAKTLDYLGVNADGANKVIGAMGNNLVRFNELIDISNESFDEGTSLIEEYNTKNSTLAATLEKIGKTVNGWFSSEGFNKWLFGLVNSFAILIGATDNAESSGQKWRNTLVFTAKVIAVVISALVTNVSWQKLNVLWTTRNTEATLLYNISEKARAFFTGITTIATQAQAVAVAWATKNTVAMREAQVALGIAMKTTPWGFIFSAISAIVVAYQMFSKTVDETAEIQTLFLDIQNEATKSIAKEKAELEVLAEIAKNETISKEKRLDAIKKLNEIIPDYIGNLTLENIKNQEGINILKKYTEEIYKNARARAIKSNYDKLVDEQVLIENKPLSNYQGTTSKFFESKLDTKFKDDESIKQWANDFTKTLKDRDGNLLKEGSQVFYKYRDLHYNNMKARLSGLIADKNQELSVINAKIKALEPEVTKNTIEELANPKTNKAGFNAPNVNSSILKNTDDPNSSEAELYKLKLDEYSKFGEMYKKYMRQLEDDKIAIMQDGYDKDTAIENLRYAREMEDLSGQKLHAEQMAKLDEDIAKAKEAKDTTKEAALHEIKKYWLDKNLELDTKIQEISQAKLDIHKTKLATIDEKWALIDFKKKEEQYNREKDLRETEYNLQLAALGDNEDAKAVLKKKYEKTELEEQRKFLTELLKEQQAILAGKSGHVDLSILTDEEKQKLIDSLNETIAKLAKLGIEIDAVNAKKFDILQGQGTDIFGFSPEQWDSAFAHLDTTAGKFKALETVIGGLQNAYGMYANFVAAKEAKEMKSFDRDQTLQKNKLKKQLDGKLLSQKQYDKAMERLELEKEKKVAEQEYKQAKRERTQALVTIAINTGIGVMKAVAQSPTTLGLPWSAIIAGMGIAQAALLPPLPAKGFQDGLYPDYVKREQDGKIFKSTGTSKMQSGLFSKPRILVGEGPGDMPEMVIDKRAYSQISPATKNALLNELRGIKGFEGGLYNNKLNRIEDPASSSTDTGSYDLILAAALNRNSEIFEKIDAQGLIAYVSNKDLKSMGNLKSGIKDYEALINKTKK